MAFTNAFNSHGRECKPGFGVFCIQFTSDLPKTEKPYTFFDYLWDNSYEGLAYESDKRRKAEDAAEAARRKAEPLVDFAALAAANPAPWERMGEGWMEMPTATAEKPRMTKELARRLLTAAAGSGEKMPPVRRRFVAARERTHPGDTRKEYVRKILAGMV